MALTDYTYSIQNDFPNHKVAPSRLTLEIQASSIVIALDHIETSGDDCHIWFKDPLSTTDFATLNGIVAVHSGDPLPSGNYDADGNPVFAPTFMYTTDKARLKGYTFEAPANQSSILDVEVTNVMIYVQGGQFWIMNPNVGDKSQFQIVDKNDVMGLHTQYSLPLGTPIVLYEYVKDDYYPTADLYKDDILMPTLAPVTAGLYLRCVYTAVNTGVTRTMGVRFRWYET
jgi:hypothetical protein